MGELVDTAMGYRVSVVHCVSTPSWICNAFNLRRHCGYVQFKIADPSSRE